MYYLIIPILFILIGLAGMIYVAVKEFARETRKPEWKEGDVR